MKLYRDYEDRTLRLTDERLAHILEHPEMSGLENEIERVLRNPQYIVRSLSDENARLYYRFMPTTRVGGKYLCVVVKDIPGQSFVLTAYLTDKIKKGTVLWNDQK